MPQLQQPPQPRGGGESPEEQLHLRYSLANHRLVPPGCPGASRGDSCVLVIRTQPKLVEEVPREGSWSVV